MLRKIVISLLVSSSLVHAYKIPRRSKDLAQLREAQEQAAAKSRLICFVYSQKKIKEV